MMSRARTATRPAGGTVRGPAGPPSCRSTGDGGPLRGGSPGAVARVACCAGAPVRCPAGCAACCGASGFSWRRSAGLELPLAGRSAPRPWRARGGDRIDRDRAPGSAAGVALRFSSGLATGRARSGSTLAATAARLAGSGFDSRGGSVAGPRSNPGGMGIQSSVQSSPSHQRRFAGSSLWRYQPAGVASSSLPVNGLPSSALRRAASRRRRLVAGRRAGRGLVDIPDESDVPFPGHVGRRRARAPLGSRGDPPGFRWRAERAKSPADHAPRPNLGDARFGQVRLGSSRQRLESMLLAYACGAVVVSVGLDRPGRVAPRPRRRCWSTSGPSSATSSWPSTRRSSTPRSSSGRPAPGQRGPRRAGAPPGAHRRPRQVARPVYAGTSSAVGSSRHVLWCWRMCPPPGRGEQRPDEEHVVLGAARQDAAARGSERDGVEVTAGRVRIGDLGRVQEQVTDDHRLLTDRAHPHRHHAAVVARGVLEVHPRHDVLVARHRLHLARGRGGPAAGGHAHRPGRPAGPPARPRARGSGRSGRWRRRRR